MREGAFIVSIVFGSILIIVGLGIFHDVWKTKTRQNVLREQQSEEDEHLALLARLEERIEVLERIVTDEKFELRRRFRDM